MPDEPLSHVRWPDLPWRQSRRTECGRAYTDVAKLITRAEARALINKHGKQRAAFLLCITCCNTASIDRGDQAPDDFTSALSREFYGQRDPLLADELYALSVLVAAHRQEFDDLLAGMKDAVDLAARRRARRTAGGRA